MNGIQPVDWVRITQVQAEAASGHYLNVAERLRKDGNHELADRAVIIRNALRAFAVYGNE